MNLFELSMATIYTIGHSTHSQSEFEEMLRSQGVARLVDIRRYPGSRRYPHFSKEALAEWLPAAGIDYVHELALGGRRKPEEDSPNTFWRNAQFRAYADYMSTAEFRDALARLIEVANLQPTAIMCAEAVPWRCHRNLVADALVARSHNVLHIMSAKKAEPHVLNPHAEVEPDGTIIYRSKPADQTELFEA
jgi:uncharacterized protein (DUF488 family)